MEFVYCFVIVLVGLLTGGGAAFFCLGYARKMAAASDESAKIYGAAIAERQSALKRLLTFKPHLVEINELRSIVEKTIELTDVIQADRGRSAITQVELETVELRLRELEEIERELEASEQETKEELRVLQRREDELRERNDLLRNKISESKQLLEQLLSEVEFSDEQRSALERMQEELDQVTEQSEDLLEQISKGNDQYFSLKRRYDALDIEYAQLYEKFIGD